MSNGNNSDKCSDKQGERASSVSRAAWTALMILALAAVFFARLLDYPDNPFGLHCPPAALLAGISAIFIIMAGASMMARSAVRRQTMFKRKGALLIALGVVMLLGFFVFREIIPFIF